MCLDDLEDPYFYFYKGRRRKTCVQKKDGVVWILLSVLKGMELYGVAHYRKFKVPKMLQWEVTQFYSTKSKYHRKIKYTIDSMNDTISFIISFIH